MADKNCTLACFFDTEKRQYHIGLFEKIEGSDDEMQMLKETILQNPEWLQMDDDTWYKEIPAIKAQIETSNLITKIKGKFVA